ncbi:glycosyltransferase family 4 protein [Desulfovibrio inopinatus]|uniref:glycosyltransferase family 4 protein n=1 Tax=Desulfovibrio inopinatus TaxID=102109 RepID=UPI0004285507|nr:glycosyltransferase family 1 protein [Desulfovibrio inopinatus]
MRIGFDVSQTGKAKAGCGYLAHSLLSALSQADTENEYIQYPVFGDAFWDTDTSKTLCIKGDSRFSRGPTFSCFNTSKKFWRNPPGDFEKRLGSPDIIHSNNFYCPSALRHARLVYTLHDLSFVENPGWTTEDNRAICFNGVFTAAMHADFIVSNSRTTAEHFLRIFPHYPRERIEAISLGCRFDAQNLPTSSGAFSSMAPKSFWLSVGTVEPRKNHARLFEAYAAFKARHGHVAPLVLAGGKGWLMEEAVAKLRALGIEQDVVLTGYVSDETLSWLYANCYAFLYPSLFEGFGLPVLEAMAHGAAVVTSNTSALPEVTGPHGALLVDPTESSAIADAMTRLVEETELRETLSEQARKRAQHYSWDNAARQMMNIYEKTLALPGFRSTAGA